VKDDLKKFSIIDEGFIIEGAVEGKGRLIVKGLVKGSITGDDVVVAQEGAVYADARAKMMTIGGFFEGAVDVEGELIILSTGKCSGKIKCKDLVIEAGGILNAAVACQS
jgi:cytoskeletal protein CcmA (bactofilin family)